MFVPRETRERHDAGDDDLSVRRLGWARALVGARVRPSKSPRLDAPTPKRRGAYACDPPWRGDAPYLPLRLRSGSRGLTHAGIAPSFFLVASPTFGASEAGRAHDDARAMASTQATALCARASAPGTLPSRARSSTARASARRRDVVHRVAPEVSRSSGGVCHGDGSARSERWRPGASRRRLDVSARARISPDDNWYDAPSSSNFINVRSEDELRDVMRAAYGNARASTLLVVEFYAKWCNSCRRLYPRLCKLAAQEQDVLFVKIEFDECKDLCRKLGVVKLPYFHIYNGSGSRLADFAASLDPVKFRRLTDAIDANRGLRCAVPGKTNTADPSTTLLPSLVKLHHVTFEWRGGGDDAMIVGDPSGGWTHTLALDAVNDPIDGGPTHAVTCILPTGTYRFKFIVDGEWRAEAAYPVVADADDNVNNEIFVGAASWPFQWVQVPGAAPPGPPGNASSVPVALDLAVPEPHVAERNGVGGSRARETLRRRSPPGAGSGSSGAGSGSSGAGSGSSGAGSGSSGAGRVADPRSAKPPSAKPNKSAMAAPVSPGVAKIEVAESKKQTRAFDPAYKPPASKSTPPTTESWPKKVAVSAENFSTKKQHDERVAEEAAQAFRALKFQREEAANAAANAAAGKQSSIFPGAAPVPSATPAPVSRADLLTLEERVARLEKLLADRGIGEDQWLNEG